MTSHAFVICNNIIFMHLCPSQIVGNKLFSEGKSLKL